MSYQIVGFKRRDLPEIIFSKQVLEKLKVNDLPFPLTSGFRSQYFKKKKYWVGSDGHFAYLQNKSNNGGFNYYKSKDWTKIIIENLPLQNYLNRLGNEEIVSRKSAIYPDWSNINTNKLEKVVVPVRDAEGLFLFLNEGDVIEVNLYERNLKDDKKLTKIITLADFSLIPKS